MTTTKIFRDADAAEKKEPIDKFLNDSLDTAYNAGIDAAIFIAKHQMIHPVQNETWNFIKQETFIIALEHLKK